MSGPPASLINKSYMTREYLITLVNHIGPVLNLSCFIASRQRERAREIGPWDMQRQSLASRWQNHEVDLKFCAKCQKRQSALLCQI